MSDPTVEELLRRVRRLEDEADIRRLIMAYGPAADAGAASLAAEVWDEDGVYDWDGDGSPYEGRAAVERMLRGESHQGLIGHGVAHFVGPLLVDLDGDRATALSYSLVMRHHDNRFYLWRVSAVRWDVQRVGAVWKVGRRTNRLLDASGAGRTLFTDTLREVFGYRPE
jgi:hypothetical protein